MLTPSEGMEVEASDLVGSEDLVLEKAEQESVVSLIERDHANVSFCSNHILGTVLPPPSVGGLRQRGPVTRPSMLSSGQLRPPRVGDEVTVDHVRKVPLQTAHGLFVGLARFPLPIHVGLSVG
jgi:hypothetical protein